MTSATLRRILKEHNLRRRSDEKSPVAAIICAINQELDDSGCNLGYKTMQQKLQKKYNVRCTKKTTFELLIALDPVGIEGRRKNKLKRRKYRSSGPFFVVHIGRHDKLNKYGFCIHGGMGGFSRKLLWLEVASSNKNPKIIAHYYLKTLSKYNCMPTLVRSDAGTENVIVESLQQSLRYGQGDKLSDINSFIKGKSMPNQRIENF